MIGIMIVAVSLWQGKEGKVERNATGGNPDRTPNLVAQPKVLYFQCCDSYVTHEDV